MWIEETVCSDVNRYFLPLILPSILKIPGRSPEEFV